MDELEKKLYERYLDTLRLVFLSYLGRTRIRPSQRKYLVGWRFSLRSFLRHRQQRLNPSTVWRPNFNKCKKKKRLKQRVNEIFLASRTPLVRHF